MGSTNYYYENELKKIVINMDDKKRYEESTHLEIVDFIKNNMNKDINVEIFNLINKIPLELAEVNNRIDEQNKSVYGIKLNVTKKEDAIKILEKVYKINLSHLKYEKIIDLSHLGLKLYFSNKNIVEEILISKPFSGKTIKGFSIGESVEKSIELYGEPKIRSLVSAFWSNFSVFLKDEIVTAIKFI